MVGGQLFELEGISSCASKEKYGTEKERLLVSHKPSCQRQMLLGLTAADANFANEAYIT